MLSCAINLPRKANLEIYAKLLAICVFYLKLLAC
jgi:hypothetical protein